GVASLSTSSLSVGSHSITATYSGSANFLTSTGSLTQTVNKANTTTTVTNTPNPSFFGQSVTFSATVVSSTGVTTDGTVTFKEGNISLGDPVTVNSDGKASLSTSSLGVGSHTISAQYSGSGNFNPGSANVTQTVSPGLTIND